MTKLGFRILVCGLVLALGWAVEARGASLSLDKGAYIVGAGSTADGVAHIIASSTDAGGRLVLTTTTPSVATVSPGQVTLVLGPQGYVDMLVPFTLTGIAGGGTILQVQAYSPGASTPFIGVYANVTVIECPATLTLEGEPDRQSKLAVLYAFRDEVMRRHPQGLDYIRDFYQHAWEGSYLLLRHPALRDQTLAVLNSVLPAIGATVQGRRAVLTAADIANIEALLQAYSAYASPALQTTLRRLLYDLDDGGTLSLFGFVRERRR